MGRLEELIEELVNEHKTILKEIEAIEEDLNEENIKKLIAILKNEVETHALKEEGDLRAVAEDRFDFEVLNFAHDQVKFALEELEDDPTPQNARRAIGVLKSHFMEEENIYFPEILGVDPITGGEG